MLGKKQIKIRNIYFSRRRLLRHVGLLSWMQVDAGRTLPMFTVFQTPLRLTSSEMFMALLAPPPPPPVPPAVELSTGMFMMFPLGSWIWKFFPL